MAEKSIYGQFCPIALTAEILAERWTPLVVRELLCGSTRFNDLQRGLPRMSSSLLSRRLKELEAAGVVERRTTENGRGSEYHITDAGKEFFPILMQMGEWAQRWLRTDIVADENLDPDLLMWDIHRNISHKGLPPDRRVIVEFYFKSMPHQRRSYWMILENGEADLCYRNPGYETDLKVTSEVLNLVEVWLGHVPLADALARKLVELEGSAQDILAFRSWFGQSLFAPSGAEPPRQRVTAAE